MPNDILNINQPAGKPYKSKIRLLSCIAEYFKQIDSEDPTGKPDDSQKAAVTVKSKKADHEQATFTGLALFLGFNSLEEFNNYEANGRYSALVKRARLRVEAGYEKKLHTTSATGAIFALKAMGWKERSVNEVAPAETNTSFKMVILPSETQPAAHEKEVIL